MIPFGKGHDHTVYQRCKRIIVLTLCVIVSANLLATPVLAVDEDKTQADIKFKAGTGPTEPLDPEDPDPETPIGPGVSGSLVIIYTTPWNFGEAVVSAETQMYSMVTAHPNVQTADLRGSNVGWQLQVAVTPFTDESDAPSLPGARVHIYGGRSLAIGTKADKPVVQPLNLDTDGEAQNVVFAGSGAGMGHWIIRLYPETNEFRPIELEIPPAVGSVGNHQATVRWSFNNTP